jgi:hypothetical protein
MDSEAFTAVADGISLVRWEGNKKTKFFQCQFRQKKKTRNFVPITTEEPYDAKVSCTVLK